MNLYKDFVTAFKTVPSLAIKLAIAIVFLFEMIGIPRQKGRFAFFLALICLIFAAVQVWKNKSAYKKMHELSPAEKGLLAHYMAGRSILYLTPEDGVIRGLATKGIVFCTSHAADLSEQIPYEIEPWARDYLMRNPSSLQGASRYELFEAK